MATTPLFLRRLRGNITDTAKHYPFSYIFIGEANKNIDAAKEVRRKPRQLRRLRWCLRYGLGRLYGYNPSVPSVGFGGTSWLRQNIIVFFYF